MATRQKVKLSKPPAEIRIRQLRPRDVEALRNAFASGVIAPLTRYSFPMSLARAAAYYSPANIKRPYRFVILAKDRVIGVCSLQEPRFSGMELTIGIFDEAFQGRGVGRRAIQELCEFGFKTLRLKRIELGVYPWNARAIRCYLACGFEREALLRKFLFQNGKYEDALWMSRLSS